jgi:hypothetical protein
MLWRRSRCFPRRGDEVAQFSACSVRISFDHSWLARTITFTAALTFSIRASTSFSASIVSILSPLCPSRGLLVRGAYAPRGSRRPGAGCPVSLPQQLVRACLLEDDGDIEERAAESEAFADDLLAQGPGAHVSGEPQ